MIIKVKDLNNVTIRFSNLGDITLKFNIYKIIIKNKNERLFLFEINKLKYSHQIVICF